MANLSIASRNETIQRSRRDPAAALRMADRLGFGEGVCNRFSFAVPGADGLFPIDPRRLRRSEIAASGLLLVDGAGAPVEGDSPPEDMAGSCFRSVHRIPERECPEYLH